MLLEIELEGVRHLISSYEAMGAFLGMPPVSDTLARACRLDDCLARVSDTLFRLTKPWVPFLACHRCLTPLPGIPG